MSKFINLSKPMKICNLIMGKQSANHFSPGRFCRYTHREKKWQEHKYNIWYVVW